MGEDEHCLGEVGLVLELPRPIPSVRQPVEPVAETGASRPTAPWASTNSPILPGDCPGPNLRRQSAGAKQLTVTYWRFSRLAAYVYLI